MSAATKLFALLAMVAVVGADAARAWERGPAPIEFATRVTRQSPQAAAVAATPMRTGADTSAPARRIAAIATDQPDILYGYGRISDRPVGPALDLRGRLRSSSSVETLADDAFDVVAPSIDEPTLDAAAPPMEETVASNTASNEAAPAAPPSGAPPATDAYFVQVGAFADPANAERVRAALQDMGPVTIEPRPGTDKILHRVRLGQWPTRTAAELACDVVVERGFAGAIVAGGR